MKTIATNSNMTILLVIFFFFLALVTRAQSLAVERFDVAPTTLHDHVGAAAGWFGNWHSQNNYTGSDGYSIVDDDPMTHSEVPGVGNYCVGGGNFTSTGRYFDVGGTFVDYEDANGRIGVGTIYFSFLIRKDEDTDIPIEIIFADDPGTAWAINQELIKVGYFGASSNSGGDRFWSVAAFNEDQVDLSGTAITVGETYQIIVEIAFDVTTRVNMWVNPPGGNPDLLNPDATVSSTEDLGFWNIILYFNDNGTGHGSFDEFAFSEELEAVLPVEYTELKAVAAGDWVDLKWTTANELINDKFLVQSSRNGRDWQKLGEVTGNGTSNQLISYQYRDHAPRLGLNFYRLIQIDFDGTNHPSKVFKTYFGEESGFEINTFQKQNHIDFVSNRDIEEVAIHDMNGKTIDYQMNGPRRFTIAKDTEKNLIYFVQIQTESGIWREKVLSR